MWYEKGSNKVLTRAHTNNHRLGSNILKNHIYVD